MKKTILIITLILFSIVSFAQLETRGRFGKGIKAIGNSYVGNITYDSTYWDDLQISVSSLAPGASAPSLRTFLGTIKFLAYQGGTANDISYGEAQFNHKYKLSTVPHIHIHYAIEEAAEAGDTVVIQFEYTWADINELYPAPTTVTTKIPVASKTALTHYIQELTDPTPGSGKGGDNISSQIIFRLERLQNNVSDTYDGANEWFFITSLDIHIEQDSPGSRNEYIK